MHYYCINCNKIHEKTSSWQELVFTSGFVYVGQDKMNAGTCNQSSEETKCRTA
jgi:hypothetical protein